MADFALDRIQPIVLAGGKSARFGSDKLLAAAPTSTDPDALLIDHPVSALRSIFGDRVALVGLCADAVRARADALIPDEQPGEGPLGGVISALRACNRDVFVLAGDLINMTPSCVQAILDQASTAPGAPAVIARTTQIEPCIGLYRREVIGLLTIERPSARRPPLHQDLQRIGAVFVDIDPASARNVNTPDDLESGPP